MPSNELLGVYLNDHLAGSSAGLELAEKLRDNNQGTALGDVMAALHLEIEQDRKSLEELMARLDVARHPVKDAAGWVLERLSRLRLNPALTGSAELTRLLETEALSLGIEGKLAMWLALKEAAAGDQRLAGTDYDRLIERARVQRRTLEPHRVAAAARAFAAGARRAAATTPSAPVTGTAMASRTPARWAAMARSKRPVSRMSPAAPPGHGWPR